MKQPDEIYISIGSRPHVVIRASAGSGKTYQLSNRYLDLLHRHAPPETILATTFTRKAAGEILERILRRLAQAASSAGEAKKLAAGLGDDTIAPKRAQEMLVALCRSLHRVSVSTIDSFFSRIASTFRHELGLPPSPQVVDESDALAARVRAEAIEAMLGDDDAQVLVDLLRRLHHDSAKRGITQAIDDIVCGLYDTFRQTSGEAWRRLTFEDPLPREEVAGLIVQFEKLAATAQDKNFAKAIQKARTCAERAAWDDFLGNGLCTAIINSPAAPTYYKKPITPDQQAVLAPLIEHAKAVLLARLAAQTAATFDLLERFDLHYTRLREERRLLLFSDLPHKLARELPGRGDDILTEICFRLDASVQHLLLDEFQDTSFDQWSILKPFAQEVTSVSDRSRTFFCVGDIKQAIYGWRGGRAEIFDRIERDLFLPEEAQVTMATSRRSAQIVLDAVNHFFGGLGGSTGWSADDPCGAEAARWAARFEPHRAANDRAGYVEISTSPGAAMQAKSSSSDAADCGEEAMSPSHEDHVAEKVAALASSLPGRSIGVLVATNRSASHLIYSLKKLNVDASAEGRASITGDPAVDVVLAALHLVDHPGDSAAAFHVLNSPLAPIIGLRGYEERHVVPVSQSLRRELAVRGFASVITDWTRRLAPCCDAGSALRLTQLIELADRFASAGGDAIRTRTFIESVHAAQVEEPSQAQVRVMTVHKAKGLEFDVVVLPELRKKVGQVQGGTAVYIDRDDATDEVRAVYRATNEATRALSPQLQQAYEQEQLRRLRDDLCAIYVAMTRPRHALHIVLEPVKETKNGTSTKGCDDQSVAALIRHGFPIDRALDHPQGGEVLWRRGDAQWFEKGEGEGRSSKPQAKEKAAPAPRKSTAKTPSIEQKDAKQSEAPSSSRRTWRQVAPSSLHGEGRVRVGDLLRLEPKAALQRGTLVHAWCSAIDWLEPPAAATAQPVQPAAPPAPPTVWPSSVSDEALIEIARAHTPIGRIDSAALAQEIAAFRQTLAQPGVIAALQRPASRNSDTTDLWRERPFAVRIGDDLLRGSFDRVVITSRGGKPVAAALIDFKTDQLSAPGQGNPSSAASLIAHYRPQLAAYRSALAAMLGLDPAAIRASLLFLATGELYDV